MQRVPEARSAQRTLLNAPMHAVAERSKRAYLALLEWAGLGSIPANPDALNVSSFRRWRFEMSPLMLLANLAQAAARPRAASPPGRGVA